jgi:hypothetical protein
VSPRAIFDTDWPEPPKPPRKKWWERLLDWAVAKGWLPPGENHDPTDIH